jgi:hypothetical protein
MLIQVDIDSTLYDADKLFGDLAAEAGIKWPRRDNEWKTAEEISRLDGSPCNRDDLVKVFRKAHSKEIVSQQKPYPHAAKILQEIVDTFDRVEIAYVSDRNEQQTGALREWLDANGFLHNEDIHVAATKDKRHWMREKKPEIVIDDRVRTILMARYELNSTVVALQHNHNINLKREADGIYICKDWTEIGKLLMDELIPAKLEKGLSRV